MRSVEIVLGLVLLSTMVAALAGRLSAPAPSLLVLVGLCAGLVPGVPTVRLSPEVVSLVVLPPLLYAAGQDLSVRDLRSVRGPVAVLAVGLVLATAAAVAGVAVWLLGVGLPVGFVLGAVLASTDPVAVTALARTLRLPPRLEVLVSAESLFNDATSLVLFRVAVSVTVVGGGLSWGRAGVELIRLGVGGALLGLVVAFCASWLRRRSDDAVLETVIMLLTPYVAYVAAETVGASGVTAVVVTGVAVGALGTSLSSSGTRLQLAAVSGTVVFLLESVVFSLIGLQLPSLIRALHGSSHRWLLPALVVTGVVVAMRALWVFLVAGALQSRAGEALSWRAPAVITWAGTRGVVPLTAALSIPLTVESGVLFPERNLLLVVAISVSVLTLIGQGLTLRPLTLVTGVAEGPEREQREYAVGELALADAALGRAQQLADAEAAAPFLVHRLVAELQERHDRARLRLDELQGDLADGELDHGRGRLGTAEALRALRRDTLRAETDRLARLLADGDVSEAVWRRLQRGVDLRDTSLSDRRP